MNRARLRLPMLLLGIIAAVAVVCSHFFPHQTQSTAQQEPKTEHHSKSENPTETVISIASTSLPSSHFELNRDVFFLFETLLTENKAAEIVERIDIPLTKLFDILLGAFISPNAP